MISSIKRSRVRVAVWYISSFRAWKTYVRVWGTYCRARGTYCRARDTYCRAWDTCCRPCNVPVDNVNDCTGIRSLNGAGVGIGIWVWKAGTNIRSNVRCWCSRNTNRSLPIVRWISGQNLGYAQQCKRQSYSVCSMHLEWRYRLLLSLVGSKCFRVALNISLYKQQSLFTDCNQMSLPDTKGIISAQTWAKKRSVLS